MDVMGVAIDINTNGLKADIQILERFCKAILKEASERVYEHGHVVPRINFESLVDSMISDLPNHIVIQG